jgi:hypothetical protein
MTPDSLFYLAGDGSCVRQSPSELDEQDLCVLAGPVAEAADTVICIRDTMKRAHKSDLVIVYNSKISDLVAAGRPFNRFAKLFVDLVNAFSALQVQKRQFFHDLVLFAGRDFFEFIDLFLLMPQVTVYYCQLGEDRADASLNVLDDVAFLLVNLV